MKEKQMLRWLTLKMEKILFYYFFFLHDVENVRSQGDNPGINV